MMAFLKSVGNSPVFNDLFMIAANQRDANVRVHLHNFNNNVGTESN